MKEKTHQLIKIRIKDYELIKQLAKESDRTIQSFVSNLLKNVKKKKTNE